MKKGFTLVELVIVIVIVGILSIVAVPIYKGYVDKARLTEGKALASAIKTAQTIYYAEHGAYYEVAASANVGYDPVLQIDARGNKYFDLFRSHASSNAGAWAATAVDSRKPNDYIALYWNINTSAPVSIGGHRLPVFNVSIDGKNNYQSS